MIDYTDISYKKNMGTNLNVKQNVENEVDLRDIFFAMWRQKIVIISITLLTAILAGLISQFFIKPVYQSELNIIISIPEVLSTRFGDYKLPISSNQQYIKLITSNSVLENTIIDLGEDFEGKTLEGLRDNITIVSTALKVGDVQNSFDIIVSANSSQEALKIADTLFRNYAEFLDVMTKERAVTFYHDKFSMEIEALKVSLGSKKEILAKNEELLKGTTQTIYQKDVLNQIQKQLNTDHFIVLENVINPNYIQLENEIILNKQAIYLDENSININNDHIEALNKEKEAFRKYYESGSIGKMESSVIGVINSSVYLSSQPVAPNFKASPNIPINILIGALIGGVISVFISLIKEFWFKKTN